MSKPAQPCSPNGGCFDGKRDPKSTKKYEFDEEVAMETCGCGAGYYKPDGSFVSGALVRAGKAPKKPEAWTAGEIEAGKPLFAAHYNVYAET